MTESLNVMFFKCHSGFDIICISEIFIYEIELRFIFIKHLVSSCHAFLKETFIDYTVYVR